MQSKTVNPVVVLLPLLLLNAMVIASVRPVNLLGIMVMNTVAITITLAALRFLRK